MYRVAEEPSYELPWPLQMSDVTTPDPGIWSAFKDLIAALLSTLALVCGSLALMVLNGIRAAIRRLDERVTKLETERSEVAVMNTQISTMARLLEQSQERMEQHHEANVLANERDREVTQNWRENVMTPKLTEITTELALTKRDVGNLERQVKEAKDAAASAANAAKAAATQAQAAAAAAARRRRGN